MRRSGLVAAATVLAAVAGACQSGDPPTVTPGPAATAITSAFASDGSVVEIPMGAPPADMGPVEIAELLPYNDPDGHFSVDIPFGWAEVRPTTDDTSTDVKVGAVFQPPTGNALLTVTQFDNGQVPESVGVTANSVIDMTGWRDQPGYQEIARETPLGGEGEAMRLEIEYTRASGTQMHSLVLFQTDGTTFSMVHAGVERSSWQANEGKLRDILESYEVPAAN